MPSDTEHTPVSGDGVLTIPDQDGEGEAMPAVDLTDGVQNLLLNESVGNIQADNRRGRDVATLATNVLMTGTAQKANELGTIESKAHANLIATPQASPAVQQG